MFHYVFNYFLNKICISGNFLKYFYYKICNYFLEKPKKKLLKCVQPSQSQRFVNLDRDKILLRNTILLQLISFTAMLSKISMTSF